MSNAAAFDEVVWTWSVRRGGNPRGLVDRFLRRPGVEAPTGEFDRRVLRVLADEADLALRPDWDGLDARVRRYRPRAVLRPSQIDAAQATKQRSHRWMLLGGVTTELVAAPSAAAWVWAEQGYVGSADVAPILAVPLVAVSAVVGLISVLFDRRLTDLSVGRTIPGSAAQAYEDVRGAPAELAAYDAPPEACGGAAEALGTADELVDQIMGHHLNLAAAEVSPPLFDERTEYPARMEAHPAFQRLLRLGAEARVTIAMASENADEKSRREATARTDMTAPTPAGHELPAAAGLGHVARELLDERRLIERVLPTRA